MQTYPLSEWTGQPPPGVKAVAIFTADDQVTLYEEGDTLPGPTLDERRCTLRDQNLAKRLAREKAGMSYEFPDGAGVAQTRDERDLVNINGITTNAMIAQAAGVTEASLPFRDADNVTHLLTPAQAIAFGVAVGAWVAQGYQIKWAVDEQIAALASIEDAEAFDVDAAWD